MNNRMKKVPFIEQLVPTECGLCCITMLLNYYNNHKSISEVRNELEVGRDGLTLSNIKEFLSANDMYVNAFQVPYKRLVELELPAIIFWDEEHYVILEKIKKNEYYIVDPAIGRAKYKENEFLHHYSNIIIVAYPLVGFKRKKREKNLWLGVVKNLARKKQIFATIAFVSGVIYFIQMAIPMLIQRLVDGMANYHSINLLRDYSILFLYLLGMLAYCTFFKNKSVTNLQIDLDQILSKTTFTKLLKLPYKFFETHTNGDLLFRLNSLEIIRDLLSEHVIDGIIQIGMGIFITFYMIKQSLLLSFLAIILFFLNGIFIMILRPKILELNQKQIIKNTKLQSVQTEAVQTIFGIKASSIEEEIFQNWRDKYKDSIDTYKEKGKWLNIYTTFISIFQNVAPFIILIVGIYFVTKQRMTIGAAIAFYTLAAEFFCITISIFNMWNDFSLATSYMERVNDILNAKEEKDIQNDLEIHIEGKVELKNVSFSYTKLSDPTLKNIDMKIKAGEKIAIVGSSGSGKTTLIKILLGLYDATTGEILYDGINSNMINKLKLRKQVGIVPQDMNLFNQTIMENIRLNNKNINLNRVEQAAQVAQIAEEIEKMPMKYYTLVSEMGLNLSGGQRQRIALARAIVNEPRLVVLDEATSSLDNLNEKKVSEYFQQNGYTRIVVAHRLSTIVDADCIYVMDKGRIVESGSHTQLLERGGIYSNLYEERMEG